MKIIIPTRASINTMLRQIRGWSQNNLTTVTV